jgi:LmbE family N-acetylglucosaminyl deacetylase
MFVISPHPDDEVLFCAYKIMREKPIVVIVTHPTLQGDNGHERLMESYKAMRLLGASILFLGIPEHELNETILRKKLEKLGIKSQRVIVPALDRGHPHHDLIHFVCTDMFWNIEYYKTYGKGETRAIGWEVEATKEEQELKQKAMNCYQTQINNPNTAHYFSTLKEYE